MKVCTTCGSEWSDDTKFCPNDGTTLRSEKSTDLIGSVIADRYHIEKKLGEGGMGAVYLGEHVKMGRKSAIKVMTQAMASDPEAIARFNREAANAARINHPNVCAIYDFGETKDEIIYLAMEFIEGESLNDLLKREGALAPARAASILEQTGNALQAAHDLGIVHRDLKPDNIMLTRARDGSDVVKVVDFGIAKAMGGEEGQKVTKTGLVVGTPEYMSPEQLSGDVLDGRSDIYSLALVFFRMLTGTLPFQADTAQEMMIKRLTDEPLKLADAIPGIAFPLRLQEIMDRALQRMPSERYDSSARLARDVADAVRGMAAPAIGMDGATQLISADEVGATARLLKTRVAAKDTPTPTTPRPTPSPVSAAPKKKPVVAIAASVAVLAMGGVGAVMVFGGGGDAQTLGGGPVTGDTASEGNGPDPRPLQIGNRRDGTTGNRSVTPPVDSPVQRETTGTIQPAGRNVAELAQVHQELEEMIELLFEDGTRTGAIRRAEAIFGDATWPDSVRAGAASMAGTGYQMAADLANACIWINRALTHAPNNDTYRRFKSDWGCP